MRETYLHPGVPSFRILSGAVTEQGLLPTGGVHILPPNEVIEVTLRALDGLENGGPHPFHLHENTFYVVRSAGSSTYDFVNPVRRDVVSIGQAGDSVTFRFTTDNAGPWLLRCHIDWHLALFAFS